MTDWQIVISPEAGKDIKEIHFYISAELMSPEAASAQVKRILKAIHGLETLPLRHAVYEKEPWHSRGLRFFPIDRFVIFYVPDEDAHVVVIARVIYGGRNIGKALTTKFTADSAEQK